jgi:phasin family protein
MASKANTTDKMPSEKTASKSDAEATLATVKPAPVNEQQGKLVSKIVTVSNTPTKNGTKDMTKTTETTAAKTVEAVTAKAKTVFADLKVRAGSAAEKGKKIAADAYAFNKENVAAAIESGKLVAKGAQDISATNVEFAKANFADLQTAAKEISAVRTPADFVKVQSELAQKSIDTVIAQSSKNTEAMIKLLGEVFQPLSNRVAITTEFFKKAA